MRKKLYKINGTSINQLPVDLNWIGDLIYYDWALLSVLSGKDSDEPFIKAWVNSSSEHDRFLVFKTTKRTLAGYILKEIPYFELFKNIASSYYYAVDVNKSTGEDEFFQQVSFDGLNEKYLPNKEVRYQFPTQDVNMIREYFSLESDLEVYLFGKTDVIERAKKECSEIINIHLTSSNQIVGFGEIQSNVLGETLVGYNKMAESVALKIYEERNELKGRVVKWQHGERDNVIRLSRTTYYAEAASFDIYLTPVKNDKENDGSTSTENIVNRIFDLFKFGDKFDFLDIPKSNFPQEMLTAYEAFLGVIQKNGIRLAMQYANPEKGYKLQQNFDSLKATSIIKSLRQIEAVTPRDRKFAGKFTAFHRNKQTFEFTTLTGSKVEGTFTNEIAESIRPILNFKNKFNIVVSTTYEKKPNRITPVERNLLISCYEDN